MSWYDVGSILEFRIFADLFGQQIVNVQHYRVESSSPAKPLFTEVCEQLATAFYDAFKVVQSQEVVYSQAQIQDLGGVDIAVYTFLGGESGNVTGDCCPPFVAYGIRQNRTTRLTRHGQKRIAGVPENYVTAGDIPAVHLDTIRTNATAIWDGFQTISDPAVPSNHVVLTPIIWGGFDALYPDGRYNYVSGIAVNPHATTQNSRKFGRGS